MGNTPTNLREASQRECQVMRAAQTEMMTQYDEARHLPLLRRLWAAMLDAPFEREGKGWRRLGFQREDPTSDVRGGGELCLRNLVYLAETHGSIARRMLQRREERRAARGDFANYPWAAGSMNVTRLVCEAFGIVDAAGAPLTDFERLHAAHWGLATTRLSLNEVWALAFLALDALWDLRGASYMDFGAVLAETKELMRRVLARGPQTVQAAAEMAMREREGLQLDAEFVYGLMAAPVAEDIEAPAVPVPATQEVRVQQPAAVMRARQAPDLLSEVDAELEAFNALGCAPPAMRSGRGRDGHLVLEQPDDFFAQYVC